MAVALLTITSSRHRVRRWRSTKSRASVRKANTISICPCRSRQRRRRESGAVSARTPVRSSRCRPGSVLLWTGLEFALIVNAESSQAKNTGRVPITLLPPEPYIGHLGLGGVGDTKGRSRRSAFRDRRQSNVVTNAKLDAPRLTTVRGRHRGWGRWTAEASSTAFHPSSRCSLPRVSRSLLHDGRGRERVSAVSQSRGSILVEQMPAQSQTYKNIFAVRSVGIAIPPIRADARPCRCSENRIYDRRRWSPSVPEKHSPT